MTPELIPYLDRSLMMSNPQGDITIIVRHFTFDEAFETPKHIAKVVRSYGAKWWSA